MAGDQETDGTGRHQSGWSDDEERPRSAESAVKGAFRPLVSIIISSYNYERFLPQAIDSVLNQTYENIEVIVVDDGSSDTSPDIIRSYGDLVVPVFRPNGGQAAAQNSGFAKSKGEIILILDSDDLLYRDAIAAVVAAWTPDTAKAQFYLDAIDSDGNKLDFVLPVIPMMDGDMRSLVELYGYYPSPPTSGNAYARTLLERLMPLDEKTWKRGPDGLLNALSALYGAVVSIHRSLGGYRIHGANMYAGAISLGTLRANMQNELDRETAIHHHLAALQRPVSVRLCRNIPSHMKARLVSLKLDRQGHLVSSDSVPELVRAGISSAWAFPHLDLWRRVGTAMLFVLVAALPRAVLARLLDSIFMETSRLRASGRRMPGTRAFSSAQ